MILTRTSTSHVVIRDDQEFVKLRRVMLQDKGDSGTDRQEVTRSQAKEKNPGVLMTMLEDEFTEVAVARDQNPRLGAREREHVQVVKALAEVASNRPNVVPQTDEERVETSVCALVKEESHVMTPPGSEPDATATRLHLPKPRRRI